MTVLTCLTFILYYESFRAPAGGTIPHSAVNSFKHCAPSVFYYECPFMAALYWKLFIMGVLFFRFNRFMHIIYIIISTRACLLSFPKHPWYYYWFHISLFFSWCLRNPSTAFYQAFPNCRSKVISNGYDVHVHNVLHSLWPWLHALQWAWDIQKGLKGSAVWYL